MNNSEYKYKIKSLYNRLPMEDKKTAMEEDAGLMGISVQHLRRLWNIRLSDESEAKPSQLKIISERFGLQIEDIINEATANVSSP